MKYALRSKPMLEFPPLLDIEPEEEHWPAPPIGWDHEAVSPYAVQRGRLHLSSGREIEGDLHRFEPLASRLLFRPAGSNVTAAVTFDQLRSCTLVEPLKPKPHAGTLPLAEHERDFRIELADGTLFTGPTVGRVESHRGVFLVPPVEVDLSLQRMFLPRTAYRKVEFGPTAVESAAAVSWITTPEDLLAAIERQPTAPVLPTGTALIHMGLATTRQIERALQAQAEKPDSPLGQILVAAGIVTQYDLEAALAHKMGYPLVDVERFPIQLEATRRLSVRAALSLQALPLMLDGDRLIVAVDSPSREARLRTLQVTSNLTPVAVLARRHELSRRLAAMTAQDIWAGAVPPATPKAG
jgi:hypothetical protein